VISITVDGSFHQTDTFARLYGGDTAVPNNQHRVELVANWRMHPPVTMDIGPVLHPDDVMAGKMAWIRRLDGPVGRRAVSPTRTVGVTVPPVNDSSLGTCQSRTR